MRALAHYGGVGLGGRVLLAAPRFDQQSPAEVGPQWPVLHLVVAVHEGHVHIGCYYGQLGNKYCIKNSDLQKHVFHI